MNKSLVIVADAHIWGVESAFASFPGYEIDLRIVENRDITPEIVRDADILLTRSSTLVDAALLEGSRVRFAGTATIGDDHYDKAYLKSRGISFANAAGSSTGSVIEYMIGALLELHDMGMIHIPETRMGIIGAGRIGGRFERICRTLGMDVFINDPPRARREGNTGFSSLEEVLECADVISLHTPLTRDGSDPTFHLIDADVLERFQGSGLINAGRGACVDNDALIDWLDSNQGHFAVLDCWEGEPEISQRLLRHPGVVLATPHIAGHSLDGKAANTQFVHDALCRFLGVKRSWNMNDHLPPADDQPLLVENHENVWAGLRNAVIRLYDIRADHERLKACTKLHGERMAWAFTEMRRHYPVRRAWHTRSVHFVKPAPELVSLASGIGLRVV
jgi:erythronate-4-phosphate dehydrogenase